MAAMPPVRLQPMTRLVRIMILAETPGSMMRLSFLRLAMEYFHASTQV
jgi:hypothetical protein